MVDIGSSSKIIDDNNIHHHPITSFAGDSASICQACNRDTSIAGGYRCSKDGFVMCKSCVNTLRAAFTPSLSKRYTLGGTEVPAHLSDEAEDFVRSMRDEAFDRPATPPRNDGDHINGSGPNTPPQSNITSIALIPPDATLSEEAQNASDIRARHLRKASEVDLFKLSELIQQPVLLNIPATGNRRPSAGQRPSNAPLPSSSSGTSPTMVAITISTPQYTTHSSSSTSTNGRTTSSGSASGRRSVAAEHPQRIDEHRHIDRNGYTSRTTSNGSNGTGKTNPISGRIQLDEPLLSSSDPDPYSSQYVTERTTSPSNGSNGRPSVAFAASPSSVTFAQLPSSIRALRVSYILLAIMVLISTTAYAIAAVTDHSASTKYCNDIATHELCGAAFPRCATELHSATTFVCLANDQTTFIASLVVSCTLLCVWLLKLVLRFVPCMCHFAFRRARLIFTMDFITCVLLIAASLRSLLRTGDVSLIWCTLLLAMSILSLSSSLAMFTPWSPPRYDVGVPTVRRGSRDSDDDGDHLSQRETINSD